VLVKQGNLAFSVSRVKSALMSFTFPLRISTVKFIAADFCLQLGRCGKGYKKQQKRDWKFRVHNQLFKVEGIGFFREPFNLILYANSLLIFLKNAEETGKIIPSF
jgi:hypothetical protein